MNPATYKVSGDRMMNHTIGILPETTPVCFIIQFILSLVHEHAMFHRPLFPYGR